MVDKLPKFFWRNCDEWKCVTNVTHDQRAGEAAQRAGVKLPDILELTQTYGKEVWFMISDRDGSNPEVVAVWDSPSSWVDPNRKVFYVRAKVYQKVQKQVSAKKTRKSEGDYEGGGQFWSSAKHKNRMSAKDFLEELHDRGFTQAYQNEAATHSTYEFHLSTDKDHPVLFWTSNGKIGLQGEYPTLWRQRSHREMYGLACDIISEDVGRSPSKKRKRDQDASRVPEREGFKFVVENKQASPAKGSETLTAVEDKERSPLRRSSSSTNKKVEQEEADFMRKVKKNISMDTAKAIMTVMHVKKQLQTRLYNKELASESKVKKAEIILRHETVAHAAVEVLKQWMGAGKKDEDIVLIIMNTLSIDTDRAEDMVGVAKGRVWEELQPILSQIQIKKEAMVVVDEEIIAEEASVPVTPTLTPVLPPAEEKAAELPANKSRSGDAKTKKKEKELLEARMAALNARIENDRKTLAATQLMVEAGEKRDAEARAKEAAKAEKPVLGDHKKGEQ
jgi:hypothetical protein